MQKNIAQVLEFHKTFNHPIGKDLNIPDKKRFDFRVDFLREELLEKLKAVTENDLVQIADGLTDSLYVINGFIIEVGLHHYLEYLPRSLKHASDFVSRELSVPSYLPSVLYPTVHLIAMTHAIYDACVDSNIEQLKNLLVDFSHQVNALFDKYGMASFKEALFDEVHRSNMTKACKTVDEAVATINHCYEQGLGGCIYQQVGEYYVVYRGEKVMKSINYSPANLRAVLGL